MVHFYVIYGGYLIIFNVKLWIYSRITIIWCAHNVICNTHNSICSSNDILYSQRFETCGSSLIIYSSFTIICGAFFITMIILSGILRNNFRKIPSLTAIYKYKSKHFLRCRMSSMHTLFEAWRRQLLKVITLCSGRTYNNISLYQELYGHHATVPENSLTWAPSKHSDYIWAVPPENQHCGLYVKYRPGTA